MKRCTRRSFDEAVSSVLVNRQDYQPKSIPFATKLFTPHFLYNCDNSPPRLHKSHNFTSSPILLPRQKSQSIEHAKPKTQPRSIPFATKLFTPHFLCMCDNSLPRLHKNHNFTYSPILLPRQKKPIHRTWLSQNPNKINSFCNQTFHNSFLMHL